MFIFSLSLICTAVVGGKTPELTYNESISGKNIETEWFKKQEENNLTLEGVSPKSNFTLVCDKDYVFNHVTYHSEKKKKTEQYECRRNDKTLQVSRMAGNQKIVRAYNIGSYPWIQEFNFGMRPFVTSGLGSFKFCIINPSDLSLNRMVAKKLRLELIKIGDKDYRTQKVKITLQGPKALFWSAHAWYDTETGNMVMYKGNKGPNTPTSVVTLMNSLNTSTN